MTIKRYDMTYDGIPYKVVLDIDHAAEVEALKAQNARLKEALAKHECTYSEDGRMYKCGRCESYRQHAPSCLLWEEE